MTTRKWALILFVGAFIALFIPFVPETTASGGIPGVQYRQTAMVSPTYYVFHCGSYINPQLSVELASGFQGFYHITKGYTFSCTFSSS